jgi:hypothetical protein
MSHSAAVRLVPSGKLNFHLLLFACEFHPSVLSMQPDKLVATLVRERRA